LPDVFIDHDSPQAMYARAGLDADGIVAKAFEAFNVAPELQPAQTAGVELRNSRWPAETLVRGANGGIG
jgi:hypothetical protein